MRKYDLCVVDDAQKPGGILFIHKKYPKGSHTEEAWREIFKLSTREYNEQVLADFKSAFLIIRLRTTGNGFPFAALAFSSLCKK